VVNRLLNVVALLTLVGLLPTTARGEDWPEYRGKGRQGIWHETGVIKRVPADGLPVVWRTPVKGGFSGPSVADGRVFITDFEQKENFQGTERLIALDEASGRILWTREWPADYAKTHVTYMPWGGSGATPTVDGDRVYYLGRTGHLVAVDVKTGMELWSKQYIDEYKIALDAWGAASVPIVEENLLIGLVGQQAGTVAWDKFTGKEVWRAAPYKGMHGTAPPIVITAGGVRQVIVWNTEALVSLNAQTGAIYWQVPFVAYSGTNPAAPVYIAPYLLISNFTFGSMLMKLDEKTPTATEIWRGKGENELDTDGLHSLLSQPIIKDGHIYGICSYGQARCLRLSDGQRLWETQEITKERARFANAHLVRNGDWFYITNDRGEFIIARLTPEGVQEISRTPLLKPTLQPYNRRQLGVISWAHPAYANKRMYMRNDEEIVCFSLEEPHK
jgi:outer membrane protein assembly factor BamB